MKLVSKANVRQIGWAAVGVSAGFVLWNQIMRFTRGTRVGSFLEGR